MFPRIRSKNRFRKHKTDSENWESFRELEIKTDFRFKNESQKI